MVVDYRRCESQSSYLTRSQLHSVERRFVLGRELGRGASGIVRECEEISTWRKWACKSISNIGLKKGDRRALRTEIAAMEALRDCQEVASLHCVFEDNHSVHLIMELCKGGDLASRLENEETISEKESAYICYSLATAIEYCHANGIIHRDLKPENVLLCSTRPFSEVRIADFGVATFATHGEKLNEIVGSPYYVSPEMLTGCYSYEVDIWSLGVILYTMLSGRLPFFHHNDDGIYRAILKGKLRLDTPSWKSISSSAKHLISRMLDPEPSRRITVLEILNHPWILEHANSPSTSIGVVEECYSYSSDEDGEDLIIEAAVDYEDYNENEDDDNDCSIPIAETLAYSFNDACSAVPVDDNLSDLYAAMSLRVN